MEKDISIAECGIWNGDWKVKERKCEEALMGKVYMCDA